MSATLPPLPIPEEAPPLCWMKQVAMCQQYLMARMARTQALGCDQVTGEPSAIAASAPIIRSNPAGSRSVETTQPSPSPSQKARAHCADPLAL